MFNIKAAAGAVRRPNPTRVVAGPKVAAARTPLTCRWSRDPATGRLVATWLRAGAVGAREPESSRLRLRPLRPRAVAA